MSAAVEPPRLTPTQRLDAERERQHEITLAAIRRTPAEPESSVTVSRNARGVYQFEVTVRDTNPQRAYEAALSLAESLAGEHPYPAGANGGTEA